MKIFPLPRRCSPIRGQIRLALLIAFSIFSSVNAQTASPSGAEAGIEGVISMSPGHPGPIRPGIPNSRPLAGTEFAVEKDGKIVASFRTNEQGSFKIALAPGHYTISAKEKKSSIGRFGPFEADVAAGQFTKVQWTCDSGMR
jgi:hypothetical protein